MDTGILTLKCSQHPRNSFLNELLKRIKNLVVVSWKGANRNIITLSQCIYKRNGGFHMHWVMTFELWPTPELLHLKGYWATHTGLNKIIVTTIMSACIILIWHYLDFKNAQKKCTWPNQNTDHFNFQLIWQISSPMLFSLHYCYWKPNHAAIVHTHLSALIHILYTLLYIYRKYSFFFNVKLFMNVV